MPGRPEADDALDALIARADLDGLIRLVDDCCELRDWDRLARVRQRVRTAIETGRQIWPAATLAEYRLALLAPPAHAAAVVTEAVSRFSIGPLTEVVAQGHTWAELAPHLPHGPARGVVAHERVLRGESLAIDLDDDPFELPLALCTWEPGYALADYRTDDAGFDPPDIGGDWLAVDVPGRPGHTVDDPDVDRAFRQLVDAWTAESNGRAEIVGVEGDLPTALRTIGLQDGQARCRRMTPSAALAQLAWAAASGGAHGRRRGAAAGRFGAWWFLAALGGLTDDWPVDPEELGALAGELDWFAWDASEPATGWRLQLAAGDPVEGITWVLNARDAAI